MRVPYVQTRFLGPQGYFLDDLPLSRLHEKTPRKPADWTKDSPELKRERSGYWLTGLGTGPDTVCFVLCGTTMEPPVHKFGADCTLDRAAGGSTS